MQKAAFCENHSKFKLNITVFSNVYVDILLEIQGIVHLYNIKNTANVSNVCVESWNLI